MSTLDLVFGGTAFPVPKKCVFELLEHLGSIQATSYAVQSSVPLDVFSAFADSLKGQTKISVTQSTALPLWFLANEFFLPESAAECATFSVSIGQFSALAKRVSELERRIPCRSNSPGEIEGRIESLEEGLESLRLALEKLQTSVEGEFNQLKRRLGRGTASFRI
jgi:hypothetical protein